ncbi:hypothetical protein BBJ28_00010879 [Nothophytophthora sp. Chile5]|nr:hypothetical protein BBJ28_00010879 [Nothophytophthora sp. Chile5]
MVFRSLFRCIRRFFDRLKPKHKKEERSTQFGADIDIEEALAQQLELQRRSGRALSSTASIAAALRQRPREMPIFATQLGNDEHREATDPAISAAVQEMQSLTPALIGQGGETPETVVNAKAPTPKRESSLVKVPESVHESPELEAASVEKQSTVKSLPADPAAPEMQPRRSSVFNMRSEWI